MNAYLRRLMWCGTFALVYALAETPRLVSSARWQDRASVALVALVGALVLVEAARRRRQIARAVRSLSDLRDEIERRP